MNITHCYWQIDKKLGAWPLSHDNAVGGQLPAMMKRRLTPLGRQAIEMLYKGASCNSSAQAEIPWVISGQHADTNRKIRLLSSLAKKEPVSPTDFSMSVHNAIIGAFSIATKNKQMHTAVAGSAASFEMGLLEAFALQQDKKSPVGYIYYDALLPLDFTEMYETDYPVICFAMILTNDDPDQAQRLQVRYASGEKSTAAMSANSIISLVEYLESNEKVHKIPIPGGSIVMARSGL